MNKKRISILLVGMLMSLSAVVLFAKDIQIVAFNDFHGAIKEAVKYYPGMAKYVTALKLEIQKEPNTIVVSVGDNFTGGDALNNLTFGEPVAEMMKLAGTSISAVGNHVFDYEPEKVTRWQKKYNWDFIVANIYDKRTNKRVAWAKPYEIISVDGVKVAFVGLTTVTTPEMTDKKFVENYEFKNAAVELEKVVKHLNSLKKEEKPNVIIALAHIASYQDKFGESEVRGTVKADEGEGELEKLCKVKGVDAVISGHSHKFVSGYCGKMPVTQAGKGGTGIATMNITLDDNNKIESIDLNIVPVYQNKNELKPDKDAEVAYQKWAKKLDPILKKVIGSASDDFEHTRDNPLVVSVLGRYACEVLADKTDTEIAIVNSGAFKTGIKKGAFTNGDLYTMVPYDSRAVAMKLNGKELRKIIEHAIYYTHGNGMFYGLDLTFNPKKEQGHRIVKLTLLNGTPIYDEELYTVSTIDFLFGGGEDYDFSKAVDVKKSYDILRDMIKDDIAEKKTITPEAVDYVHFSK